MFTNVISVKCNARNEKDKPQIGNAGNAKAIALLMIAASNHEAMPKGVREFGDDVEKKIRQVLQAQLTRMDLVNREEFDVQTQVLLRTREKLVSPAYAVRPASAHQTLHG